MFDTQFHWKRVRPIGTLARSLLVPWAFWMVVYGAVNIAQHKNVFPDGWADLLYGTSAHLWFLPFMFFVLVTINIIKPHSPRLLFWSCTIASSLLIVTASIWRPLSFNFLVPAPQWIHATPAVLIGIIFGLMGKIGNSRIIALLILGVALMVADTEFLQGFSISYTVGVLLTAIAARYGTRLTPEGWSVQPVASCMMGVYLCHMLVLKIVGAVTGQGNYVTVSLTFVIALCGVWSARRWLPSSKLVLG